MENIRMRRMGIWSEIISDITAVSAGFFLSMKIFNYSVRQTAPFYVLVHNCVFSCAFGRI